MRTLKLKDQEIQLILNGLDSMHGTYTKLVNDNLVYLAGDDVVSKVSKKGEAYNVLWDQINEGKKDV